MAANKARDELLKLIDHKAFDPVLKADPNDYNEDDQERLKSLKKTTGNTKESYHDEGSADGVYKSYKNDLSSDSAKKVQDQLRDLGLPTLPDIKDEVEAKARELGIS